MSKLVIPSKKLKVSMKTCVASNVVLFQERFEYADAIIKYILSSTILYINSLSPCVRLSDATVLRFNSPAEPARTVGRMDRPIFYGRTGPDRRPLYNFDQRSLVSQSVSGQSVCDGGYQG